MPPITIYIDAVVNKAVNETVEKFQIVTVAETEEWNITPRLVDPAENQYLEGRKVTAETSLFDAKEILRLKKLYNPETFHIPLTPMKEPTLHDFCLEAEDQEGDYACVADNIELLVRLLFKNREEIKFNGTNHHINSYKWEKEYFYPHGYQVERVTPLERQIIHIDMSDKAAPAEPTIVAPVPAPVVDEAPPLTIREIKALITTFDEQMKSYTFLQGEMKKLTVELTAAIDELAGKDKDGPYILMRLASYLDTLLFNLRSPQYYFPKLAYSTLIQIQFHLSQFKRKKDKELTKHIMRGLNSVKKCLRSYVITACLYVNGISLFAAVCKLNAEYNKMNVEQIVAALANLNKMLSLDHVVNPKNLNAQAFNQYENYKKTIKNIKELRTAAERVPKPKQGENISHYRSVLEEKMRDLLPATLYDIGMGTFACQADLDNIKPDENSHQYEDQNIYINYFKKLAGAIGGHFVEIYSAGMVQEYKIVQHKMEYLVPILESLLKMFKFTFKFDSHRNPAQEFFDMVVSEAKMSFDVEAPEDDTTYYAALKRGFESVTKSILRLKSKYTDNVVVKHIKQFFFFGVRESMFDILDHLMETNEKTIKDDYDDLFIAGLQVKLGSNQHLYRLQVETITAFQKMKQSKHSMAAQHFGNVKKGAAEKPNAFYFTFFKQLADRYLYVLSKKWTTKTFQPFRLDYDIVDLFKHYGGDMDFLRISTGNDTTIKDILNKERLLANSVKKEDFDPQKLMYLFNYMNPNSAIFRKMVEASAFMVKKPANKKDPLGCANLVDFFNGAKMKEKGGIDENVILFSKSLDKLIKQINSIPDINELVYPYPLEKIDWTQRITRSMKNPIPRQFPFMDANTDVNGTRVQNYKLAIVIRLYLYNNQKYKDLLKYKEKFDNDVPLVCSDRVTELPLLADVLNPF
jgi:hypothetical protein